MVKDDITVTTDTVLDCREKILGASAGPQVLIFGRHNKYSSRQKYISE